MQATIKIGGRVIGGDKPAYVIAEIGINHNGDFFLAKQLIDKAKECGADCVKFQKRHLESIYGPDILANPHLYSIGLGVYIPILKEVEFSIDRHRELAGYCRSIGIDYLCTPMDLVSAFELDSIDPVAFKIGSIGLKNYQLIDTVAGFGKPMLVSTGMARWEHVEAANSRLLALGAEYALLHCVSTYPVDFKDCNLRMLGQLSALHSPVGYSGHERGIEMSICAVAMGASIIERHFTLDRTMKGPDHSASLEPAGFKKMVEHIRAFELARGDGVKRITRGEQIVRESLGRDPLEDGSCI